MKNNTLFSKDFLLVIIGQIISIFGNQILRYVLPLYLLNLTGSSVLFGTISACAFIPMLVLFPIGGIIADRVNKRNIMVVLDFCTSALVLCFSLLTGKLDIVPLIAVTMMILYGIQGAYQPAVKASIPILAGTEHLMQANSIVDVINSFASMTGPVIGGLLFTTIGLVPILYVSIACFFTSAVMEIFIHIPFQKKQRKGNIFLTGFNDMKDSFGFIFKSQPAICSISLIYGFVSLLLSALFVIAVPVLITQMLGFPENTANRLYGYAQGVIAAGSIVGGLLAGILSKKLKPKAFPYIIIGCALSALLSGMALQMLHLSIAIYVIIVICCSILMILSTLLQIQMMSYIQILSPTNLIGKVISCVICVCMCSAPIGQLIYGFVFEHIGRYTYLPFYAAALIVVGIAIFSLKVCYNIEHLIENKIQMIDAE